MKCFLSYLFLTSGLFPMISSSLPIPGKYYFLGNIEAAVPITTGMAVAHGTALGASLGPEGAVAGAVLGSIGGVAAGVVAGTALGALELGLSDTTSLWSSTFGERRKLM